VFNTLEDLKGVTPLKFITDLANRHQSTELESQVMEKLLHKVGFPRARVVIGVVYLEGRGPPVSIHSVAKKLVEASTQ